VIAIEQDWIFTLCNLSAVLLVSLAVPGHIGVACRTGRRPEERSEIGSRQAAPQPAGRPSDNDRTTTTRVSVFAAAAGGVEEGVVSLWRVVSYSADRQSAYYTSICLEMGCCTFENGLQLGLERVLYIYKILKNIYTWFFFRNFGGTAVPPCYYCRSTPGRKPNRTIHWTWAIYGLTAICQEQFLW